MAFTLLISLFAPLVPTDLSSAAVISGVTGLSASDAIVTDVNGNAISSTDTTYTSRGYTVSYHWTMPDNVTVKNGDTIIFEIPANVKVTSAKDIVIKNTSGNEVGTAKIAANANTGTITITNVDNLDLSDREGNLEFSANGTTRDEQSAGWMINKVAWEKSISDDTVTWQIVYNPDAKKLSNIDITDTIGPNQEYVQGSLRVEKGTVDSNGKFRSSIPQEFIDVTPTVKSDSDNTVLNINVGDLSTAISITYQTKPDSDFNGTLENEATDNNSNKDSANKNWGNGSGDATGRNGSVTLKKVSSTNSEKTLQGAIFEIVKYDNNKVGDVVVDNLTTDKNGEVSYDKLPNGKFAFIETKAPDGYELDSTPHSFEISKDNKYAAGTITIKNQPTESKPDKTQLNVSKVWNDTNNQDKLRPGKITVQLYKTVGKTTTEVDGKTAELTAENKWTADFTDLDATDSDGNPITYTAKEVSVPKGYSEEYEYSDSGKSETITNTHPAEETTSLTVNKVWNDKKTSHPSVQVQLYKVDGDKKTAVGDPVTLSDEAGWSHTFDKLAKDATYTVEEVNSPSDYISEVSKAVNGKVTITNTPEAKTQVTVNKVWNDSNDKDHKRPTSVEAQLYANGDKSGDAVKLTANENWTHTWTDLPQNDSKDNKITYTVKEVDVPEGYAASYKTDGNVTTITNTYPAPETTSLKVNKVWKNGDPNLRPASIQVQLYANNEKSGDPVTLSLGNNWSYNFKDLVKNDDNGEPIKYTVEEVTKVQNYTPTQIVNDNAVTITNTYTPNKTQLTVNKAWNDNDNKSNLRPSSIKVQLYANDQKSGSPVTINPDKDGNWSYTFDNLDETDASGKTITYTAKEVGVPEGYGATYEYSKDGKTETITNTHPAPQTKKLTVDKIWNDNRSNHSAVKVQLYKVDGKNKTAVGEPVTLSFKDGWSYTFTDLAKDSNYTVEEVDVPNGYTSQVSSVTNGKIIITNTLKKTSLTVNKVWNDSKNKTGKRPTSIQVQLYANDKKSGDPVTIKPNKDGDWTYTFQNLDEVDENGKTISYKTEEVNVPEGYASTSKTDGNVTTITNTYPAPETTSFKVTKDWEDNNNEYGLRPNEVTVQLLANDKAYGEPIVLNQGNNWTYEFTGLPKADAEGYPMTYSVKEITNLANYNSSVDTSQSGQATIVNTVNPPVYSTSEKTQLTVNKVWNDNNNQDGKRPSEVTVQLLANGKETGKSVELSDKNNWVATFSDLDKTDNSGNPISYTVKEVKVDGYTTKVDKVKDGQVTITNTRDTDTTVPPTKSTTPSQPTTPPVKSTTPGQPVVPPVKSTTTTTTTEKTNKPKTFTDKVKQVVSGLLPQTGADKTNAIITYVGLLLIVIVIISWVMIAKRRRDK